MEMAGSVSRLQEGREIEFKGFSRSGQPKGKPPTREKQLVGVGFHDRILITGW